MIDDRNNLFDLSNNTFIRRLCDRRFGIGADGLILLQLSPEAHFQMVYFNSDGNLSSMCGNGGRCIARFAQHLGIIDSHCTFKAVDGMHHARLNTFEVALKMNDVETVEKNKEFYYLNTGSPHVVKYVDEIANLNVFDEGRKIRYNERFKELGTNVNFVTTENNVLRIRTYERGVENETLSCGTGVTAAALVHAIHSKKVAGNIAVPLVSEGGKLKVTFDFDGKQSFTNIELIGAAEKSFEGEVYK